MCLQCLIFVDSLDIKQYLILNTEFMLVLQLTYMDLLNTKPFKFPLPGVNLLLNDILYSRLNHGEYLCICVDTLHDKIEITLQIGSKVYRTRFSALKEIRDENFQWLQFKEIGKDKVSPYPKLLIKLKRMDCKVKTSKEVKMQMGSVEVEPKFSQVDSESIIKKISDEIIEFEQYSFEGRPPPMTSRQRNKDQFDQFAHLEQNYRSQHFENLTQKRRQAVMRILKSFEDPGASPSVMPTTFDFY